jgi:hypothetical protein
MFNRVAVFNPFPGVAGAMTLFYVARVFLIVGAKRWCAGGLIISMPSGYAPLTVVMLPNIFPAL